MRRLIVLAFTAILCCPVFSNKDKICNGSHEYYDPCPYTCPPQTCGSLDKVYDCPVQPVPTDTNLCRGACMCEPGYYRNLIGECISEENCRICNGPHEYFSCGSFCDNVCETLNVQNQTNCPVATLVCVPQCFCEKDYARATNGTCIPIQDCEVSCNDDPNARPGCGINCNKRCSDIGKRPQSCIALCKENACDCKDGYYLNEYTELCVRAEDCPQPCGLHEVYSNCIQGQCGPKTCKDIGRPLRCPRIDPRYCEKGCLCKPGYVRDDCGKCIPKNRCHFCNNDSNAIPGCGIYCNKRCSDIGKAPHGCITLCKENACDCKRGFYLNEETGKCVRPANCPQSCAKNEFYSTCIQGYCGPKTCNDLGVPLLCPDVNPEFCIKGCLCNPGYVRNNKGVCIPVKQCPSCGGDKNAQLGCGVNCNKRCSTYKKGPQVCPAICEVNGCDCKDGYLLDEKSGKCVLPCDCSNEN